MLISYFGQEEKDFLSENLLKRRGHMGEQNKSVQLKNYNRRSVLNYIRKKIKTGNKSRICQCDRSDIYGH